MKNKLITKIAVTSALVLTVSTLTINYKNSRTPKKNHSPFANLSKLSIGISKALASVDSDHQGIYDSAKREVNTELKDVVKAINDLLGGAGISACSDIPAVSTTAFHSSGGYSLYSSSVGSHTTFPLSSITGVSYTNKLELKLTTAGTAIGALYVDCNTGDAEVRYLGKSDTVASGDTNLAVAYHEDSTTNLQTILLASDYNAGTDYNAAKLAVHYSEASDSSTVVYGYAENSTTGYAGTLTAGTTGTVTSYTDSNVTSGTAKNDLTTISGATAYSVSAINAMTISL